MSFADMLQAGYGFSDPSIVLGAALEGATVTPEPKVRVPLAMMNRHGLIAGATGTGKTRTLQLLAEQLSAAGVAVFAADVKGDLSGIAQPGEASERVTTRAKDLAYDWKPQGWPTEFVSLTGKLGVPLRATVSSFGPLLLSKVLGLNDTQASVLAMVFKYCDDNRLPLLDLADLRAVLQFLSSALRSARSNMGSRLVVAILEHHRQNAGLGVVEPARLRQEQRPERAEPVARIGTPSLPVRLTNSVGQPRGFPLVFEVLGPSP